MTVVNHYNVLGVLPSASYEDIKRAYRVIAMASHPDRKPGDEKAAKRFQAAKDSYEVLSDPVKREKYDQLTLNRLIDNPLEAAEIAWNGFIDRTLESSFKQGGLQ